MDAEAPHCSILMLPWLAHGHIFPFLELAKRILARKNFHIHLCTTAINFTSINFIRSNNLSHCVNLVELHLTSTPDLPPHYHTTKNLPSHLNLTLHKAFLAAQSSFSDTVTALKPDLVIYDIFQPWAARIAELEGIPAVYFPPFGGATVLFCIHQYSCLGDDFPELWLEDHERKSLDNLVGFLSTHVFLGDKDVFLVNFKLSHDVVMVRQAGLSRGSTLTIFLVSVTRRFYLLVH